MATEQAATPEGTGLVHLFRLPNARIFFAGAALSVFGDNLLSLVSGVWVKSLTGNNGAAGLTSFFIMLPTLFLPLYGLLADRIRRRRLMVAVNAAMMLVTPLLLFVDDIGDIWVIYLVMLAQGVAVNMISAASSGLFVEMLPERLLGAANSVVMSMQESMKVLAPVAGAALFAWLGGGVAGVLDALTFLLACVALMSLRLDEPVPSPAERGLRDEIVAGVRHIVRLPELRRLVLAAGLIMLTVGFVVTAQYGVVERELHLPPTYIGVLLAAQGVGSVLGGLLAGWLNKTVGETRLVGFSAALIAVGTFGLLIPSMVGVLPANFLRGIGMAWMVVGVITLMQRRTSKSLMGRTAASLYLLVFGPNAVSLLGGAGLNQVISHRALLVIAAVATAAICVYVFAGRGAPELGHGTGDERTQD